MANLQESDTHVLTCVRCGWWTKVTGYGLLMLSCGRCRGGTFRRST
jgi:hypothetical protein